MGPVSAAAAAAGGGGGGAAVKGARDVGPVAEIGGRLGVEQQRLEELGACFFVQRGGRGGGEGGGQDDEVRWRRLPGGRVCFAPSCPLRPSWAPSLLSLAPTTPPALSPPSPHRGASRGRAPSRGTTRRSGGRGSTPSRSRRARAWPDVCVRERELALWPRLRGVVRARRAGSDQCGAIKSRRLFAPTLLTSPTHPPHTHSAAPSPRRQRGSPCAPPPSAQRARGRRATRRRRCHRRYHRPPRGGRRRAVRSR